MSKFFSKVLLPLFAAGTIIDGFTTMITLLSLFRQANVLAYAFAIIGAIFVWILTAERSLVFATETPSGIKFLGLIAVLVDILTSFIGATYFIALGNPIGPINFSQMTCCDWNNLFPTVGAFSVAAMFNVSTLYIVDIWNSIRNG